MTTLSAGSAPDARGWSDVSPSEVRAWLDAGRAVLVDVREQDEFAHEHIEGASLMPLSRFDPADAAALAKGGRTLVLQCRSGKRSADAARLAARPGLDLASMTGGIEAWKQAGLPVKKDARASGISIMRQVQLVAGTFVLVGSILAWFVDPLFIGIPAFFGAGLAFAGASGTCGMASMLRIMPWNRRKSSAACNDSGCCN